MSLREKLTASLYAALLFSATLFFFIPFSTYIVNVLDFPVGPARILPVALALCLASTLAISGILLTLRGRGFSAGVSLVLGLSLFIWIKANFLLWDYAAWEGTGIDWSKYRFRGLVDLCFLLAVIIISVSACRFLLKHTRRISGALLAMQLLAFLIAFGNFHPSVRSEYDFDLESSRYFSSARNFILIVIDSFRGRLFQELVDGNPEYARSFDGFTYFPGAVADSSVTWLSLPAILTGNNYDGKTDIENFVRKVYNSYSLPSALKQNGFRIELHNCPSEQIYCSKELNDNLVKLDFSQVVEGIRLVYLAAFFRSSPQPVKKFIYEKLVPLSFSGYAVLERKKAGSPPKIAFKAPVKHDGHLDRHIYFMRQLAAHAEVSLSSPVFKFIYLRGIHPPYVYDAALNFREFAGQEECRGYKQQGEVWLRLVCGLLDSLKAIGAYDNSLIMVISDHGSESATGCFKPPDRLLQRSDCLLSVKPPGSRGVLRASDSQASLSDIPRTAMEALKLANHFPGANLLGGVPRRNRLHLQAGRRCADSFGRSFYPDLQTYVVAGPADDPGSWVELRDPGKNADGHPRVISSQASAD